MTNTDTTHYPEIKRDLFGKFLNYQSKKQIKDMVRLLNANWDDIMANIAIQDPDYVSLLKSYRFDAGAIPDAEFFKLQLNKLFIEAMKASSEKFRFTLNDTDVYTYDHGSHGGDVIDIGAIVEKAIERQISIPADKGKIALLGCSLAGIFLDAIERSVPYPNQGFVLTFSVDEKDKQLSIIAIDY